MIVVTVLLWTLVVLMSLLLLLVLAALLLPFEARAEGTVAFDEEDADARGQLQARFGWGLVSVRAETGEGVAFRLFGLRVKPGDDGGERAERRAGKKARRKDKAEKKGASRKRRLRDFWRARAALGRTLGRFVRALHLRGEVEGTLGLDDPVDTVRVVGILNGLAASQRLLSVAVDPDWMGERLDLYGRIQTRFRLGAFVWVALRALLDGDLRRALSGRRVERMKARRTA